MSNNIYKRSRAARFSWMALGIFFIVFCSCPIKRFFKLQLYKHSDPIESSSSNAAFAKELKDCNLINKHGLVKAVKSTEVARPKPRPINTTITPVSFFLSTLTRTDLLCFLKSKTCNALRYYHSTLIAGAMPLYLKCNRLQV